MQEQRTTVQTVGRLCEAFYSVATRAERLATLSENVADLECVRTGALSAAVCLRDRARICADTAGSCLDMAQALQAIHEAVAQAVQNSEQQQQ